MPPATTMPSAASAYTALNNYQPPSATDVLTTANTQAGLPAAQTRVSDLQSAVNNLNTSLNAVDPSVTGRTSGTFTTEGQRAALVTKEQAPIQQNLTSENANLSQASSAEGQAESQANSLASAMMTQNQDTYQKLLDQYNAAAAYEKQQQDQSNAVAAQQLNVQQLAEKTSADQASLAEKSSSDTQAALNSAAGQAATWLNKYIGSDGYVSPQNYGIAAKAFESQGYTIAQFNQLLGSYMNPSNPNYKYYTG